MKPFIALQPIGRVQRVSWRVSLYAEDQQLTHSREELQREISLEQAHVDEVYTHLDQATSHAKDIARQGREIYQTDRTNFLREEDGTALFERDAFAYQAARRLAILDAEHEGLVFGRLDLRAGDEVRYIGRLGVRNEDYEPLVIDWRAPAAEPFYRATQADPMGVIRRRVLRCRDDKVIGLEDDLLDADAKTDLPIIGEGALMAALTRARGRTMRDIVATIQAEQDEAIRAPYQGVTIIGGGPGTGKTVVALHRAAYLLYTNRARLEKAGVLVVGPSSVFMNYIERVLPSLGEDSVTLRAVGSVASDALGMTSERIDKALAATAKGSLRMLKVLRRLIRTPLISGDDVLRVRVTVKGEVLTLEARELEQIRDQILSHTPMNRGRQQAFDLVVRGLAAKLPGDLDVTPEEVDELISEHPGLTMFMHAWWPTLSAPEVLARLSDPGLLDLVAPHLSAAERQAIVESYNWVDTRDTEIVGWSVADIALLDELMHMLGPAPLDPDSHEEPVFIEAGEDIQELVTTADRLRFDRVEEELHNTYAHVLVDEAQDITPMQWRMIRRRGPQASWTLVGDPAQSSYPDAQETEAAIRDLVGSSQQRRFTLSTNYRSPKEVFDLAAQVITKVVPGADLPTAIRTTGVAPELATASEADLAAEIERHLLALAGQVSGTVAVVCPPSRHAAAMKLAMSSPRLASVDERLIVVTALQAKGLEYDGVLVLSPDEIVAETPGRERALYVALTRATQRMTILDVGSSSWRSALTSR